jgi:hypothetical protein
MSSASSPWCATRALRDNREGRQWSALAYLYFEDEPQRQMSMKRLSRDIDQAGAKGNFPGLSTLRARRLLDCQPCVVHNFTGRCNRGTVGETKRKTP